MKYDYLIVGAGLFGSVFARQMVDAGKTCLVIEKRKHIGGNIYSEELDGAPGIQVHKYGPHIFHTSDEEVWAYVQRFVSFNHFRYEPLANYRGKLYNLPFNMNTFHAMWGVNTPAEAQAIIDEQRAVVSAEPQNLEEQAISLVGTDIYNKLIKGYTEKQWGRPCTELPAFIIKRLPVRLRYDNNYFNDPHQGVPKGGYAAFVAKLLEGIDVRLEEDFLKCRYKMEALATKVVYTGAIDAYYDFCFGNLAYRSLRFEEEVLPMDNFQGVAGMNFTDTETPYTRIIEHKHFEFGSDSVNRTVITREYPAEWHPGYEPYYPVNDGRNQELYRQYAQLANREKKVIFGGRLAEYKYYNMDQVIRRALDISKQEVELL